MGRLVEAADGVTAAWDSLVDPTPTQMMLLRIAVGEVREAMREQERAEVRRGPC